jgi:iron complex transport system substrate-binding protein
MTMRGCRPGAAARNALYALAALAMPVVAAEVSALDDAGQTITLAQPASRIVSLAPHITEQLFAVGAGSRIVGTTEFSDHPPAARAIARVARAHSVDLERVAALQPDLIIVWGSGFPPPTVEALRRLRVPVYVNEPATLEDIASSLERLGALAGAADAAGAAAAMRARVEALRTQHAGRAAVRVFYQVWWQPLMTLSGRHVISEAIRLCAGANVFESLTTIAPQVGVEAVLAADPQLILTAEPGGRDRGALDGWRRFAHLSAVRHGQLATLDADRINRHSPRIVDEIALLCRHVDSARSAAR